MLTLDLGLEKCVGWAPPTFPQVAGVESHCYGLLIHTMTIRRRVYPVEHTVWEHYFSMRTVHPAFSAPCKHGEVVVQCLLQVFL